MKFSAILTIFFISATLILNAANGQTKRSVRTGFVRIQTERDSVEILLDDKKVGTTPLPPFLATVGKHSVTALNPQRYLWGQFDWRREIYVAPAETLTVRPKFVEIIVFRSQPDGAQVYANDKLIGETPIYFIKKVAAGTEFTIRKTNYYPETVTFNGKYPAFFNIQLSRNEKEFQRQQLMLHLQKRRQSHYRKATYGLWALSAFSGLSSIYFKQQANKNYHNYLGSSSLNKMNRYFDNSLKYDNDSNIALGVFQGCFLLSFYMLYQSYH
ncbi:MAG: hypothetical protein GXO74_12340 [Calditrichaeota bacterium]|nr:hypothetical protein [Calditrichota bacterium]